MVNAPPKALFSVSPTAVTTGAAVAFNASSSSDDVGTISDYAWSFGDGTRASGLTASHSYASPGTYTVGLKVTNDAGQSTSTSQTVSVYSAPLASFSINPGFAQPGAAVVVNAGSSSDPGGAITAYSWSFGDGGTASGPTPTHAYANPGTYTVTLTVTGSLGLVTSTSHAVTINPRPLSVQFSSSKQSLKAVLKHGLKVTLSTSAPAKASFVVTMPTPTAKQQRKHGKRVARARTSTILRTRALSYEPGTHSASLNLSAATVAKLRTAGKPVTLTVHMILTDVYGRTIGRSVKLTVTR
jgi:PKD repeat protein